LTKSQKLKKIVVVFNLWVLLTLVKVTQIEIIDKF